MRRSPPLPQPPVTASRLNNIISSIAGRFLRGSRSSSPGDMHQSAFRRCRGATDALTVTADTVLIVATEVWVAPASSTEGGTREQAAYATGVSAVQVRATVPV